MTSFSDQIFTKIPTICLINKVDTVPIFMEFWSIRVEDIELIMQM